MEEPQLSVFTFLVHFLLQLFDDILRCLILAVIVGPLLSYFSLFSQAFKFVFEGLILSKGDFLAFSPHLLDIVSDREALSGELDDITLVFFCHEASELLRRDLLLARHNVSL